MATTLPQEAPVVPLADYPADTLAKLFLEPIQRFDRPDALLSHSGTAWEPISHREVRSQVERIAAGLQTLGVTKGDRVAILSENRAEWAITDFAALCLGAADVPVYATLPPNQVEFILANSGSRAIFVSTREQLDKILEVRDRLPHLTAVVAFEDPGDAPDVLRWSDLMDRGQSHIDAGGFPGLEKLSGDIAPDDLATLIYTSGTTGDPKGVMLTHRNIASNVAATQQHRLFDVGPGMRALSFLPLSHSFERMVDYFYWISGVSIAHVGNMDRIGDSMVEVQPHIVAAAPRVFEKIYTRVMGATGLRAKLIAWAKGVGEAGVGARLTGEKDGPTGLAEKLADRLVFSKLRARTGGQIQAFVSGSAPLSADIARFFWAAGLPIYEGYGLTETSPVLSVNRPGEVRLGSVGPPLPGTEIRIGVDGEILARGPQVMKGYFENPEATAEALDADGWFHTGDVGELEDGRYLRITDRIKNIIVTAGGKNVAPAPMENAASMSPYVAQVVMIGDKRPFPSLLVVPDFENLTEWAAQNGVSGSHAELASDPKVHALLERETLGRLSGFARYEQPKKIAVVPKEFTIESGELTPSLKVKRKVVETNHRNLIESIYGE